MTAQRSWALAFVLTAASGTSAAAGDVVPIEFWDRPRTGRAVLEQPAIGEAVRTHLRQEGSRLVLHHGPTQDSRVLADELRAWLMALALEAPRITLRNDLKIAEPLRIEVIGK